MESDKQNTIEFIKLIQRLDKKQQVGLDIMIRWFKYVIKKEIVA